MAEEKLQKQIQHIEKTVDIIARAVADGFGEMNKKFQLVDKQFQNLNSEIQDIKDGQVMQDKRLDTIEVVLRGVTRAIDRDAVTTLNHGRRITKLERVR